MTRPDSTEAKATHLGFNYAPHHGMVETAHQQGLVAFAYTVNDQRDIQSVLSVGVDGIVSDFPDRSRRHASLEGRVTLFVQ